MKPVPRCPQRRVQSNADRLQNDRLAGIVRSIKTVVVPSSISAYRIELKFEIVTRLIRTEDLAPIFPDARRTPSENFSAVQLSVLMLLLFVSLALRSTYGIDCTGRRPPIPLPKIKTAYARRRPLEDLLDRHISKIAA